MLYEIGNGERRERVVRTSDFGQLVKTFGCFEAFIFFHPTHINNHKRDTCLQGWNNKVNGG